MCFGLCNAPAAFKRCMISIFIDMIEELMKIFMDDFSNYGSDFTSCLDNLCKILARCEEKHLVLNWEKCHFMVTDEIVLGQKVSSAGIEIDKTKIEVMIGFPTPTNVKDKINKIARPLTSHLCKEVKFDFTPECLKVFTEIKKALVTAPTVQAPDWSYLSNDFAVGTLDDVYYAIRTLDDAQKNYVTTEKELLHVKKDAKPILLRWILLFQEFDIEIKGKKVVEYGVADHLSHIRIVDDIPIYDFLPSENVYMMESRFFRSVSMVMETMSADTPFVLIDTLKITIEYPHLDRVIDTTTRVAQHPTQTTQVLPK
ncbi:hypothetical protein N665_0134s0024, partial [Sinapis alba]